MKSQIFSLEYPFELKLNPFEDSSEQFARRLIDEYSCLPDDVKSKYKKFSFGRVTASVFPNANFEKLIPLIRWMVFGFCFDDFYGSKPLAEIIEASKKAINILNGELPDFNDLEFYNQLSIAKAEFLPSVTPYWLTRFTEHHQDWFGAMYLETKYNCKQNSYPSIEDYMVIRENLIGGKLMCDQLEVVSDFIMPEEVIKDTQIQRFRQLFSRIIAWYNDVFSVDWEVQRGEKMNLVLIIENEKGCTRDEAYAEAINIHNKELAEFIKISDALSDFGEYNEGIRRYVENTKLFFKGQEIWYKGTERYSPKEVQ
ncbi:terpene synthase family protein [Chryseobacterium polytrichastri]|uniref:Terpene synthase n=1 Tax=Chryseobacterium polytrichastri TaxID=1302687 RepID=A0A1M7BT67_9FLAO|nr:terpene synthase family protein [Chryseobacterium polytrichastri]SHL57749.1 Terpene synthase family, metal binding domain [Chryseobacterium polytrichastri]